MANYPLRDMHDGLSQKGVCSTSWSRNVTIKFREISDIISENVQNRDTGSYNED